MMFDIYVPILTTLLTLVASSDYSVKNPPLTTDWTYTVGTDPWTEYPRPQMSRDRWQSLNGLWSYRNASSLNDVNHPPTGDLGTAVMIPSCLESALSGVMAQESVLYSWFRTAFEIPTDWEKDDVVLNFGAIDYEATVFINGHQAMFHRGGFTRFAVEISQWTKPGSNELIVFVHDPTDSGDFVIPTGKQTFRPRHIFYTPCTGIWQSVFIEPVPKRYIEGVDIVGNMQGVVNMTVHTSDSSSQSVQISVLDSSGVVGTGTGNSDAPFTFTIPNPSLWSTTSPKLYDVAISMGADTVKTYTGFRTFEKGTVRGVTRPLLNGEFIFAFGTLDQGYWPDGIFTPPSYEAMVYDLKVLKSLGFNMLRKHIKVETDLFYRACDEMGILVMQDMPSLRALQDILPDAKQQTEFERQLVELIETHKSFPSIYTWVIYNEGWGQLPHGPDFALTDLLRTLDPTRLVDATSGWDDHGAGDYSDNHHYSEPQCGTPFYSAPSSPYDPMSIGFEGEFGGIGHNVSIEHLWNDQNAINTINETYELDADIDVWNYRSHLLLDALRDQTERFACSGGVWTQTTDVEGEVNGLLTYDRRLLRADKAQWSKDIQALYSAAAAQSKSGGSLTDQAGRWVRQAARFAMGSLDLAKRQIPRSPGEDRADL